MNLNLFTLLIANAMVGILLSIVMELFASHHKRFKGFGWLSLSYLSLGLGHGLVGIRELTPAWLSIVVGNGLISITFFFWLIGIQLFRELNLRFTSIQLILFICILVAGYIFGVQNADLNLRITIYNFIFAFQIAICVFALFREQKGRHHISKYVVAFPLILVGVSLLAGMIAISLAPPQPGYLSFSNLLLISPILLSFMTMIATSLGFIWMSVERAEGEVRNINDELQESLENSRTISIKLKEQNNFLTGTLDTVPIPIFYKNTDGIYQNANNAFYRSTGLQPEDVIGRAAVDIASRHTWEKTEETDQDLLETGEAMEYETQLLFRDGLHHEVIVNKAVFRNGHGEVAGIIGAITDITERKIDEAKIKHMALHDSLTGLSNRHLFFSQLKQAVAKAKRHQHSLAVHYVDLDGFKEINDRLGHDAGDVVLKVVAKRLKSITRESDTVCRLGGDEFAVLAEIVGGRGAMATMAGKIIKEISEPISTGEDECIVGASVGIAIYPDHAYDADTLLKNADSAMYKAKENGKDGFAFFSDSDT
jgi:diguanylate cyclase (GGDEF)-like protein/PAS domain S-box-containing protein